MENKKALILFLIILVLGGVILGYRFLPKTKNNENQQMNQEQNQIQGLEIEILEQGSGQEIRNGDTAVVHYTGTLENGTKFDSSLDRGMPFSFILGAGQVIKGWDLGVLGMKIGEKRKLTIAPELGYGQAGTPGGPIPPDATLIFEVELLEIQ